MRRLPLILFSFLLLTLALTLFKARTQTRERVVNVPRNEKDDVVKVDVDLVTLDALVMDRKTSRVVGNLKREDFVVMEDGVKQEITHFSQDTLPLSVLLMIDRGGCLDPFGTEVHRAALDAINRLKPTDEVAVMAYHNTPNLIQRFTRNRSEIADALNRIPPADEEAKHCLNTAFFEAANYITQAGNPVGRRVIIVITGVTSDFICDGPSTNEVIHAVLESGSVVCGLIPSSPGQKAENGVMNMATGIAGVFKVSTVSVKRLAEETGGEVLADKPEFLDHAFNTLISHLRTRYSMGFVSTNKKYDGTVRKLKVEVSPAVEKAQGKLVVKTRHSYIAAKK